MADTFEMGKSKTSRKKLAGIIAFILMLNIASTLIAMTPAVNAVSAPSRQTGTYIAAAPNPIGLNQQLWVNLWVAPAPSRPNVCVRCIIC